ncbi:MAG: glycosyltransferase [Comamonadaceae bacterium]|nr:MAG: glycosyltransferase [Comamonadaceae bacterium]
MRRFGTRYPGAMGRLRDFAARHPTLRRRAVKTVRWGLGLLGGRPSPPAQPTPAAAGASAPPPAPKLSMLTLQATEPAQAGGNIKPLPAGHGKRVLSVGHVMPWPPRAGNEYRIHQMITQLANEGRDVLLVVCPLPHELPSPRHVAEAAAIYPQLLVCGHDGVVRHNLPVGSPLLHKLEGLPVRDFASILGEMPEPESRSAQLLGLVRTFCPDPLIELMLSLESSFKPQVLLAEYVFMARPFSLMQKDLPKIIDTIDVFSTKAGKVERYGVTDGLAMTEAEESELAGRADVLIAIQPAEATDLARLAPARKVITVGVDFLVRATAPAPEHAPVVLLVASSNPMNVKGLHDFLRFSWPFVRRQVPDAELRVVGDVGAAIDVVPQGVRILGRVENLDQAYADASVVINPTVAGTGLKIKTVEALCHLRPIVTFPAGIDGVGDAASAFCSVATDWFSFAQHVSRLLAERPDPAVLTERGKSLAAHFSPAIVYAPLTKVLDDI